MQYISCWFHAVQAFAFGYDIVGANTLLTSLSITDVKSVCRALISHDIMKLGIHIVQKRALTLSGISV